MTPIRVGICSLVAFSVLAHGAVEIWSVSVLEMGAALLLVLWGFLTLRKRQVEIRWNWLYLPLLTLGGFAWLQLLIGLSVYPYATKIELLKAGAYFLLVFLSIESFETVEDWSSFVWFLVILGAVVAALAIVQYFTFQGKLYWFRVLPPGMIPFGPFVNHNHFAGFVELISPPGLAMLLTGTVRRDKLPLLIFLCVLPIGALALSASRGGITCFLVECVLLIFAVPRGAHQKRQWLIAGGVATMALFLAIWLGIGGTVERFERLARGDLSRDRRVSMYRDTWQIVHDHPWTGTGLGTFETVFPHYESYYDGLVVDHAHNDYLELLADTGLVGGMCTFGFLSLLAWRGASNLRRTRSPVCQSLYAGSLVACTGLLLHSLVDFNFHIPSNALLFLILAAAATSDAPESQLSFPQASTASQISA